MDPSSVLVIVVLSQLNTSKWSKSVQIEYKHMLICWLALDGPTCGHIYWLIVMVYVIKDNRPPAKSVCKLIVK